MSPRAALEAAGFNLVGALAASDYDACVPKAWRCSRIHPDTRGVWIVGHGGRGIWTAFRASEESTRSRDPLDAYTRRVFEALPALGVALYTEQRDDSYLPLIALAQRAGLGNPGRLGLLMHPEFGPWVGIRGVLFLRDPVASDAPTSFAPCTDCPAPCAQACSGGVVSASGIDHVGCARTRLENTACRVGCAARAACIVAPEHAYDAEQTAHHHALRLLGS